MFTGLTCQSCPQQFVTPWSLLKHAQTVHALKIYLENEPVSLKNSEVTFDSGKQSIWSKKTNKGSSVKSDENGKSGTEVLLSVPQQSVDLRQLASLALSSEEQVFPSHRSNASVLDQPHDSRPIQSSLCSGLSENVENVSSKEFTGQKKSVTIDGNFSEHISGDVTLQTACTENLDNVPDHSLIVEKCCSSVLPKKRKRHIEIKHTNTRKRVPVNSSGPTSIYIDLEPESEGQLSVLHNILKHPATVAASESAEVLHPSHHRCSVIIQPGMTFSIPVSRESVAVAPSFKYPIVVESVTARSTSANETQSAAEPDLKASNKKACSPVAPHRYHAFQQLTCTADEPKNITDESLHDDLYSEEQSHDKVSEQKRRRYPTSRPFKCDQCDNAFNQRIHLKKHQSKHTGNVEYSYDVTKMLLQNWNRDASGVSAESKMDSRQPWLTSFKFSNTL